MGAAAGSAQAAGRALRRRRVRRDMRLMDPEDLIRRLAVSLAIGLARLFENLAEFPAPVGMPTAIGAILFSAVIGLVFGGYPAIRASKLSPIEALRSE